MPITIAGVGVEPPPLSEYDVTRYWSLSADREFSSHTGYQAPYTYHLPLPNTRENAPPRAGMMRWPTGASRWATCHALATSAQLDAIRTALGAGVPAAVPVTFSDGTTTITTSLWLLEPHPIRTDNGVYFLTLVDDRWWWYQAGDQTAPASPASWTALLTSLFASVGVTPTSIDTPSSAYSVPYPPRWNLGVRPVPHLIDAAARSCGMRVIRKLNGEVHVQNYDTARTSDDASWTTYSPQTLSGGRVPVGDVARAVPASVSTVFWGQPPGTVTRSLAGLALSQYAGVSAGAPGKVGQVSAELPVAADSETKQLYATQAATDYYRWALSPTEATFRLIQDWTPTGLNDAVEWFMTPAGWFTRVNRLPYSDRNLYGDAPISPAALEGAVTLCSGSEGQPDPTSPECVTWYTMYLHLGSVLVSPGQVLTPRQRIGYLGFYSNGAHLHFALGDGDPIVSSFGTPLAGQSIDVDSWLDIPIVPGSGPRQGDPPDRAAYFTPAEVEFIHSRFAFPLDPEDGTNWYYLISSPFHDLWDYYAVDIGQLPQDDQGEVGQPVYAAFTGNDIQTTVMWIGSLQGIGWGVVLQHRKACCPAPNDDGQDPHEPDTPCTQSEGPNTCPPGPTPVAAGGYVAPVTRICIGPVTAGRLLGRAAEGSNGPVQEILIGEGLELVNGVLQLAASTPVENTPRQLPVVVDRVPVLLPAGAIVGHVVCSPTDTDCCAAPAPTASGGCCEGDTDPQLPIIITGPFGADCDFTPLLGTLTQSPFSGDWSGGLTSGTLGLPTAAVTLACGDAAWELDVVFTHPNNTRYQFTVPLAPAGDGSVLYGTLDADPAIECAGTIGVAVGHPCAASGSGASGSGNEPPPTPPNCTEVEGLDLLATVSDATGDCTCFPSSGTLVYQSTGYWRWSSGMCSGTCDNGEMFLYCTGGLWTLNGTAPTSTTTSPFQLVFDRTAVPSGTYRITVTVP